MVVSRRHAAELHCPMPDWKDGDREWLRAMVQDRVPRTEIARRLGRHEAEIHHKMREMGIEPPAVWTPERIERFLKLREEGLSSHRMALDLGISQGAVARRLNTLPQRSRLKPKKLPPPEPEPEPELPEPIAPAARLEPPDWGPRLHLPSRAHAPILAPDADPVSLLDVRHGQCRWIIDDNVCPAIMCGAPTKSEGSSWCRCHAEVAYVPARLRMRTA